MSTLGALFICVVIWAAIMTLAAFFFGAAVMREREERAKASDTKRTR
jgi:hypothetical protein